MHRVLSTALYRIVVPVRKVRLVGSVHRHKSLRLAMVAEASTAVVKARPAAQKDVLWHHIMEQVAVLGLFADSKHFVDCPVKRSWDEVANDWDAVNSEGLTQERLERFVDRNFGPPGRRVVRLLTVVLLQSLFSDADNCSVPVTSRPCSLLGGMRRHRAGCPKYWIPICVTWAPPYMGCGKPCADS
jgi:hypothetical protein